MARTSSKVVPVSGPVGAVSRPGFTVGRYLGNDAGGRPLVALGQEAVAVTARCMSGFAGWPAEDGFTRGVPVLLALDEAAGGQPVIIGLVHDTAEARPAPTRTLLEQALPPLTVAADGKRVLIEASQEVVLMCGKGSITLESNGRVVIKGTELVSKASGSNRIRGASVSIN